MRVLPVLDLLNGVVVRGVGGRRHEYQPVQSCLTTSSEPLAIASAFRERLSLNALYVADLNGIQQSQPHVETFAELARSGFQLLVDSGIRSAHDAARVLDCGAAAVIVGSETLAETSLLKSLIREFGHERIIFSLDLKAGQPLVCHSEWTQRTASQIAHEALDVGITQLIVLDLVSVGESRGLSTLALCRDIRNMRSEVRLITGGGVRNADDLWLLQKDGINDVLVSTSLHNGSLGRREIEMLASLSLSNAFPSNNSNC